MPVDVEVVSAAENVLAEKAARVSVGDRLLHDLEQIAILAANVDVSGMRADGDAGDHHAFDHRVRIVLENQPVFAGARFALVAVAQHVLWLGRLLGHERPLHPGIESRAAAPAQAGVLDFVDHRLRPHAQGFLHGFVAVEFEIAVDVGRAQAKALGDDLYFVGMGDQ